MTDKEKQKFIIFGSIIVAVVVLFLLFKNNPAKPATVIEQSPDSPSVSLPTFPAVTINGGDPRLVYTPSQMSGISLPPFMLGSIGDFLPNFDTSTLPDNDSPENNQSGNGSCASCAGRSAPRNNAGYQRPLFFG